MEQTSNPAPTLASAITGNEAQPTELTPANPELTPPVAKEEPLSAKFAALARKQKALEAEKSKWKEERHKEDGDRSEYLKWKEDQSKPKAKKTPIEALMTEGYSYEDAAQFVMNDNRPTAEFRVKEVETKFETFKREQEEKEAAKLESEKTQSESQQAKAIEDFKTSINDYVIQNADTYELISLHEAQGLIYDTISAHYEQTKEEGSPKILSTKEASDLVEAYLEERVEKSIATKKLQAKLKPADEQKKESAVQAFTSKTLNNSVTSSSGTARSPARDEAERIQRALALLP